MLILLLCLALLCSWATTLIAYLRLGYWQGQLTGLLLIVTSAMAIYVSVEMAEWPDQAIGPGLVALVGGGSALMGWLTLELHHAFSRFWSRQDQ